jgi:hypothetical protein
MVSAAVLLAAAVIGYISIAVAVECGEGCEKGCEDWDEWSTGTGNVIVKYAETVTLSTSTTTASTCAEVPDGGRPTHNRVVSYDDYEDFETDCPNAGIIWQTGAVKGEKTYSHSNTVKVECEES